MCGGGEGGEEGGGSRVIVLPVSVESHLKNGGHPFSRSHLLLCKLAE